MNKYLAVFMIWTCLPGAFLEAKTTDNRRVIQALREAADTLPESERIFQAYQPAPVHKKLVFKGTSQPAPFEALSVETNISEKTTRNAISSQAQEGTPFDQLGALYARTQEPAPSREDLRGWFAGRCYTYDMPRTPIGVLLAGLDQKIDNNDGGPLFPPKKDFRLAMIQRWDDAMDYFDNMTKEKEAAIEEWLPSVFADSTSAKTVEGSLASRNEKSNLEYRVRKLIKDGATLWIGNNVVLGDGSSIEAGKTASFCYFFKKVH